MRAIVCGLFLSCVVVVSTAGTTPAEVYSPYLGEYCIDPGSDGDLTTCYGLDPFVDLEAYATLTEN